jgi:hypothetical protein
MKNFILKLLMLYLILFITNIALAQKNNRSDKNKLVIQIKPVKEVFSSNDSAFFKIIFINNTDSVIHISKHPSLYVNDYYDMYPTYHGKDIYTFILRQNKKHVYKPYLFSISVDNWYEPDYKRQDSILHEEKIPIEIGGSATLLLDLFPYKPYMSSGKYKARIAFFLNNERPFILIKSNWTKFVFEKNHEK